jgi:hypothetical protein
MVQTRYAKIGKKYIYNGEHLGILLNKTLCYEMKDEIDMDSIYYYDLEFKFNGIIYYMHFMPEQHLVED